MLPSQNEIKSKIALATNSPNGAATPETTRRNQLKAELDALRGVQGDAKQKRSKIFEDLKRLRDDIAKKVRAPSLLELGPGKRRHFSRPAVLSHLARAASASED